MISAMTSTCFIAFESWTSILLSKSSQDDALIIESEKLLLQ